MKDVGPTQLIIRQGNPSRLAAHFDGEGVNFALFSEHALRVNLCLFAEDGRTELTRLALPERNGAIWHGLNGRAG